MRSHRGYSRRLVHFGQRHRQAQLQDGQRILGFGQGRVGPRAMLGELVPLYQPGSLARRSATAPAGMSAVCLLFCGRQTARGLLAVAPGPDAQGYPTTTLPNG